MIGIIPAAGRGARLGLPFPKELLPVSVDGDGKPVPVIADTVRGMLLSVGLDRFILVAGPGKDQVVELMSGFKTMVVYQKEPKGTGHALSLVWEAYGVTGETYLYGMPDTVIVPRVDWQLLVDMIGTGDDVALALFETKEPEHYGTFSLADVWDPVARVTRTNTVVDHVEKSRTGYGLMWGAAAFSSRFLRLCDDMWVTGSWKKWALRSCRNPNLNTGSALVAWDPEFTVDDAFDAALHYGLRVSGRVFKGAKYVDVGVHGRCGWLDAIDALRPPAVAQVGSHGG